jgi:hypothetical protein
MLFSAVIFFVVEFLRGTKKFLVDSSTCGRIRESHKLPLITAVFFGMVGCSSEGFCVRVLCS